MASAFASSRYLKAIPHCGRHHTLACDFTESVKESIQKTALTFFPSIIFSSYGDRKYAHEFRLSRCCTKSTVQSFDAQKARVALAACNPVLTHHLITAGTGTLQAGVNNGLLRRYQPKQGGQLLILYVRAQIDKQVLETSGVFLFGEMSYFPLDKQAETRLLLYFLGGKSEAGSSVGGPALGSELLFFPGTSTRKSNLCKLWRILLQLRQILMAVSRSTYVVTCIDRSRFLTRSSGNT